MNENKESKNQGKETKIIKVEVADVSGHQT